MNPSQRGHYRSRVDKVTVVVIQTDARIAISLEIVGIQQLHNAVCYQRIFNKIDFELMTEKLCGNSKAEYALLGYLYPKFIFRKELIYYGLCY